MPSNPANCDVKSLGNLRKNGLAPNHPLTQECQTRIGILAKFARLLPELLRFFADFFAKFTQLFANVLKNLNRKIRHISHGNTPWPYVDIRARRGPVGAKKKCGMPLVSPAGTRRLGIPEAQRQHGADERERNHGDGPR